MRRSILVSFVYQDKTQDKIQKIKSILDSYSMKITIRQLFYDLLGTIKNTQKEYKNLIKLMKKTREDGTFSYDAIVDNLRRVQIPINFTGVEDSLKYLATIYRRDRWAEQEYYVEVWSEKDALSSTIEHIPYKYSVPFLANHGFSSVTAMHDGLVRYQQNDSKKLVMIYLGDYDPSGLSMDESIKSKFSNQFGDKFEFIRLALTKEQVEQYNLPPNFITNRDSRNKNYKVENGNQTWEVEALKNNIVREILEEKIRSYIDFELYNQIPELEEVDKDTIRGLFNGN